MSLHKKKFAFISKTIKGKDFILHVLTKDITHYASSNFRCNLAISFGDIDHQSADVIPERSLNCCQCSLDQTKCYIIPLHR